MNALKTGRYATRFWKIEGDMAGNLPICASCGTDQADACREERRCVLQDRLTLAHLKTLRTKNLKHRESIDAIQIAQMDFIYSVKLREVINRLGQTEISTDEKGNSIIRSAVTNEDMIVLMNFANHLQKNLKAMQLTRESQDISDVAWADLANAQINPEEAEKAKQKILRGIEAYKKSREEAEQFEELDEAIRQFRDADNKTKDDEKNTLIPVNTRNPFSANGNR